MEYLGAAEHEPAWQLVKMNDSIPHTNDFFQYSAIAVSDVFIGF